MPKYNQIENPKKEKNKTKNSHSNQSSPLFFNQKQEAHLSEKPPKKQKTQQQPLQEIKLESTTDILLAGILGELKARNEIEVMKLKIQQELEQMELQAAEQSKKEDEERFEEIRNMMYI